MEFDPVSSFSPIGTLNWPILSVPDPSFRLRKTSWAVVLFSAKS